MSKKLDYTTVMVNGHTYRLTVDRRPKNAAKDLRREVRLQSPLPMCLQSSQVIGYIEQRKDRKWCSYPIIHGPGLSLTRNEALGHLVSLTIRVIKEDA